MRAITTMLVLAAAVAVMLALQTTRPDNTLPPGHPQVNPLPPGHPPLGQAPQQPAGGRIPDAAPDDVATPESIVAAYYDTISGPAGMARDWDRFGSLFLPQARLMTIAPGIGGGGVMVLQPHEFAGMNARYFEAIGYVERSTEQRVDAFGDIAHVWSRYEGQRGNDAGSTTTGVTSFQLARASGRWWIAGVLWDRER